MNIIEEIAGDTLVNLQEQEWESPASADAFCWPKMITPRGAVRLITDRTRGSDDHLARLERLSESLSAALPRTK